MWLPHGALHSEAIMKVMKKNLALAMFPGAMFTIQATSPNNQQEDNMLHVTPNQPTKEPLVEEYCCPDFEVVQL